MSKITKFQANMNGGELSERMRARIDLNAYDISLEQVTGFIPLMEGGLEAAPGLIWLEQALGPHRLIPFNYNVTQGYAVEMSAGKARFYTNDALILSGGLPLEIATPYSYAEVLDLQYEQSFDVLYLYHRNHPTQQLVRVSADNFIIEPVAFENGPFQDRNKNESSFVTASGVNGNITITSNVDLFEAGDVDGLFKFEADDFATVPSWEPGITVSYGKLLNWNERVYLVVGGATRTGTVAPIHTDGVEWDGIGGGKDLNDKDAGGVQLEYLHDRIGIVRITGFTNARSVSATVIRRLPFTSSSGTGGGIYFPGDPDFGGGGISYNYGTWRWAFGAFSQRRGFAKSGTLSSGRHILAKGSTLYGSVVGDLANHAELNELGEVSTDMAFIVTLSDANVIEAMIDGTRPVVMTARGCYTLEAANQAQGIGPGNIRAVLNNSSGSASAMAAQIDGRSVYISRSRRRIIEADYEISRGREEPIELTRYARHFGSARFMEIAAMRDPERLVWAVCGDGTLAAAAYVPEEQVLGWFRRELANGMAARSICIIGDPAGELEQLLVSVQFEGNWHVMRMGQIRQDGEYSLTAPMLDLALEYEGAPATTFGPFALFSNRMIDVVADGIFYEEVTCAADGKFTLPRAASKVFAGLPFPASFTDLAVEAGGDNGPARSKKRHVVRFWMDLLNSRGLQVSVQDGKWMDVDVALANDNPDAARPMKSGYWIRDDAGSHDREGKITVRRAAPFQSTIRGIGKTVDVQQT